MNKLFTKIATLALGATMAVGVGVAVASNAKEPTKVEAAEQVTNTLTFGGGSKVGSYTSSFEESDSASETWTISKFNNNNWNWPSSVSGANKAIKVGNKTAASVGTIQNKSAFSNTTFTKIDLYISARTSSYINSIKVYGGSTSSSVTTELASVSDATPSTTTPTSLTLSNQSAYSYYNISFDMKKHSSSNGLLTLDKVLFYQDISGSTPSVNFSNPTESVGVGNSVTNAATGENLGGATISYTSGDTNVATVNSSTGAVTGVAFGSTTITAKATVDNVDYEDSYTIYITSSSTAYYSVAQARAAIDTGKGLSDQYTKGVVYKVDSYNSTYHSITYWISDNGSSSNPLEVYGGFGIGGANFSSIDDVKVGDIVVVKGTLKKYNSTYEYDSNNQLVSQISVASIAVKTAPSDVDYGEGEYFDPTGLVVTATYNDTPNATTMDFAYADLGNTFTFEPALTTQLTDQSSVSISLFGQSTTQSITVTARTITSITVTGTDMTNKVYVKNAAWDFTGLSLTVTYNTGDPIVIALNTLTVGTDFTVDHNNADGTTSLTISGTYDGHSITSRTITGISYISEVTWDATETSSSTLVLQEYGLSLTLSNGALNNNTDYRVYKNATATVASTGENIRKIEFTGTSSNPISGMVLTSGGGELSTEGYDGVWLGDSASIVFTASVNQTRITKMIITTESGYEEVHVDGLSVDGSAATIGQEFDIDVVEGMTHTLHVAVTPDNTTDSKVINYSIDSGSGVTVSEAGVITAGTNVGSTAVIRAESDADSTYYVLFNVTVVEFKTVYDIDFSCSTSSTQFDADTWAAATSGSDADYLTYDSTNAKVYPDANAIKFGSSSVVGSLKLTTPGSVAIERVIIRAKSYGGEDAPTISVNGGSTQSPTADWSYLVFDLGTAAADVTIAGTKASKGRFYIDDIIFVGSNNQAAVGAYGYAADFMNSLDEECAELAVTTATWSTLNGKYTTMGTSYTGSQAYLNNNTPNENGHLLERTLARYDFIVGKYNKTLHLSGYDDFMSRDPDPVGSSGSLLFKNIGTENAIAIIVVISIVSVSAIGGYFFLRKRKETN